MKTLVHNIILLALLVALTSGILWARNRAEQQLCTAVSVDIDNADSTLFVTRQGVLDELKKLGFKLQGRPMKQIDAARIERALGQSEYLENVECVKATNGEVVIHATQLVPVMRIFDGDQSYYVNRDGKRMNATASYHADVPVVKGHFTKQFPPTRLLPLIDYVEGDSTLHALVSMYAMRDSNNVYIVPAIYGHIVNLGQVDNIPAKFAKLEAFYNNVMPQKGWLTYDTISVKWDHQVVATRRNKTVKEEVTYDPDEDEPMPDVQTMAVDDNNHSLVNSPTDKKKATETRKVEPKKTEAKKPEAKKVESPKADAKKADTKKVETKKADAKKTDTKKPEATKKATADKNDKKKNKSTT